MQAAPWSCRVAGGRWDRLATGTDPFGWANTRGEASDRDARENGSCCRIPSNRKTAGLGPERVGSLQAPGRVGAIEVRGRAKR